MAKCKQENIYNEKIVLDEQFSTTRSVFKAKRGDGKAESKCGSSKQLHGVGVNSQRQEGGLRLLGYYKKSKKDMPLVTVITVTYNAASLLERTISSVLRQKYENVEFIIVDGESTDETLSIIRRYENAIDYWVSEKDVGIYDAMNKGCLLASGVAINFLNAGDEYCGDVIQSFSSFPVIVPWKVRHNEKKLVNGKIKSRKMGMPVCHQSIFYKNDKNLYSLEYELSSDYDFTLRSLSEHSYFFSDVPGYVVYDNNGVSQKKYVQRDYESLKIIYKYFSFYAAIFFMLVCFKCFIKFILGRR